MGSEAITLQERKNPDVKWQYVRMAGRFYVVRNVRAHRCECLTLTEFMRRFRVTVGGESNGGDTS